MTPADAVERALVRAEFIPTSDPATDRAVCRRLAQAVIDGADEQVIASMLDEAQYGTAGGEFVSDAARDVVAAVKETQS